jgi:enoyl-CoA hydratase
MSTTVVYEASGAIGYITLDRPRVLNAMNGALLADLAAATRAAGADPGTRVLVLRGAGRGFCAGADLTEASERMALAQYRSTRLAHEQDVARLFRHLDKPVIAQIHGMAVGGGAVLTLLADLRIGAEGTRFEFPEVRVGATASIGGLYHLARVVGLGRAFEVLYTAEPIDAAEALRIGLVNRVVPRDDLERAVRELAERIAGHFALELALTRQALRRGLDLDFDAAVDSETTAALISWEGRSREQGMARALDRLRRGRQPDAARPGEGGAGPVREVS